MKSRIVKKPSVRRDEILASVAKLIYSKGYEQMTIQDILNDLNIAKGTVYHYFDSKQALLEAFIDRIKQESEKSLLPSFHDPNLKAVEKLKAFFSMLDGMRMAHRADVVQLARVWYTDDNALVRQKVEEAVREQRALLLAQIIHQGVQEGVFTTAYPDQAGEVIMSLLQGMADTHIKLLLSLDQKQDELSRIEGIITTHAAYMDAIERVLGASPNSLDRTGLEAAQAWVAAFRDDV